jgi:DnaJ-class molecular chaperone
MSPRARYVTCPDCDGAGFVDSFGDACLPEDEGAVACECCGGRGELLEGAE